MHQIANSNRPIPGIMFGLTHDADGSAIIREARILKVGIGLPKGKALNCWIHNDGKWKVRLGFKSDDAKTWTFNTGREASDFYHKHLQDAPVCKYPRKIGFFTFTRPVLQDDGSELFEPDFEAIEAHGPTPTEIDVVFLDDNPLCHAGSGYQMWSASELLCRGDGINALRVLSLAATDQERQLAAEAKQRGEKYFPIIQGCWTLGCPYSKESADGKPSPCKPGGDLRFQLARNIRVGGTAYFHTSGYRSISHIFSSLERIKTLTGGRLAGIPLKMVLRPYKTKHNGQAATQYGVSLEFRAEDVEALRRNLIEQAWQFRALAHPENARTRLLEAPIEPAFEEDDDDEPPISAQAMVDEFYPEPVVEEPPPPKQASTAAVATDTKTAALADKLKNKRTQSREQKEKAAADKTAAREGIDPRVKDALGEALGLSEETPATPAPPATPATPATPTTAATPAAATPTPAGGPQEGDFF